VANHQDKPETKLSSLGRKSKDHYGVVNTPVYRASTILYPSVAALDSHDMPFTYGRRGNPTLKSLEEAINELEGATRTLFVPSGLNAVATAILSVCVSGDHLLMADTCYGPSRAFCDKTLKRFGVETTYYDPLIGAEIERLFRPNTKAVFCESPGSRAALRCCSTIPGQHPSSIPPWRTALISRSRPSRNMSEAMPT
jgi:cystathionine beta-lyase